MGVESVLIMSVLGELRAMIMLQRGRCLGDTFHG